MIKEQISEVTCKVSSSTCLLQSLSYWYTGKNFKVDSLVFSKCLMTPNGVWKVRNSSTEVEQYCVFTWQQNDGDIQPSVGCESGGCSFVFLTTHTHLYHHQSCHFVWPFSVCHFICRQQLSGDSACHWLSLLPALPPTSLTQIYTPYIL